MNNSVSCLLILFFVQINVLSAQVGKTNIGDDTILSLHTLHYNHDSIRSNLLRKAATVPAALIVIGLLASSDNDLINNLEVREERNEWMPAFHHRADDYLQYAPLVAVYGLNALGINGKNNFTNRTWLLIKAELLMGVMVYSLKKITAVPRPDTGRPTSFPSGHTAQAFAAATFMAKEYGHKSFWYSIGAYTIATGVGVMRVLNNRHWASDVLAGAGIGILSANLSYLFHKNISVKRDKNTSITYTPVFDRGSLGVCLVLSIK